MEIKGIKAIYTHGHLYSVNQTRMHLAQKAKSQGCQFAFYGHTHVAKYEYLDGVHVINPAVYHNLAVVLKKRLPNSLLMK